MFLGEWFGTSVAVSLVRRGKGRKNQGHGMSANIPRLPKVGESGKEIGTFRIRVAKFHGILTKKL